MAQYSDIKKIGSGGFGEVYECESSDGKRYAKKRLLSTNPGHIARFRREVRLLKSLNHPNVISIVGFRVGSEPYFYLMPLCQGNLRDKAPGSWSDNDWVYGVVSQILDAIEYAHNEGVIHRDIKPDNVLFKSESYVVVSDFGLGRQIDAATSRQTQSGQQMGTMYYAAPEQVQDAKSADHTADIYSLGCLIYELYSRVPFVGRLDMVDLDPSLQYVVDKCTRTDKARRYQSVADLRSDYERAIGVLDVGAGNEEYDRVCNEFMQTGGVNRPSVAVVADYLVSMISYPDELHELLMDMPIGLLRLLVSEYLSEVQLVVESFLDHIKESGFSFSYCDTICDRVMFVYGSSSSPELRARILMSTLELAYNHNRFYVFEKVGNAISSLRSDQIAESMILADSISDMSEYMKNKLSSYVSMSTCPDIIRALLE